MTFNLPPTQHRSRLSDVTRAIEEGEGLPWLARRWNVSKVAAHYWCNRHLSEESRKALTDSGERNGELRRRAFVLEDRLELIALCQANGWTRRKLARAIGVADTALLELVKRHAPDGLENALTDFCDDEAA